MYVCTGLAALITENLLKADLVVASLVARVNRISFHS